MEKMSDLIVEHGSVPLGSRKQCELDKFVASQGSDVERIEQVKGCVDEGDFPDSMSKKSSNALDPPFP